MAAPGTPAGWHPDPFGRFPEWEIHLTGILNRLDDLFFERTRATVPEKQPPISAIDERGDIFSPFA